MELNVVNKFNAEVSTAIEVIVAEKNINYLDAVMFYIESNGLELESVAEVIKNIPSLKAKIYDACSDLNLVEKVNKLDF